VPRRKPATDSLVEWEEQPAQLRVLDWRRRAKRYGLAPGAEDQDEDGDEEAAIEPEQLIADEEPEASETQRIEASDEEEEVPVEEPSTSMDGDLVRTYLR
jgi:hypothetical protein